MDHDFRPRRYAVIDCSLRAGEPRARGNYCAHTDDDSRLADHCAIPNHAVARLDVSAIADDGDLTNDGASDKHRACTDDGSGDSHRASTNHSAHDDDSPKHGCCGRPGCGRARGGGR
jgi:hypothetical protein